MTHLDPILITSGDPAGIGPEVTHKAVMKLMRGEILRRRPVVVIGDAHLYARHLSRHEDMHHYFILPVDEFMENGESYISEAHPRKHGLWRPLFIDCGHREPKRVKLGAPSREAGGRAVVYLGVAIQMISLGLSLTVCTAPICKAAAVKAGFEHPGQTELFGEVFGNPDAIMMLVGGGLRVALVTIHEPIKRLPRLIKRKRVFNTIKTVAASLILDFGIRNPRIAVCGFNPHAGEDGEFGNEERRSITPAIKLARKLGIDAVGPFAADSLFGRATGYDAVIAMYHDQGLAPFKTAAFDSGVNVTLGLPIIRTAPDHGTAFDIVGKHVANPGAMLAAIELCHELSERRAKTEPVSV
ncbi:MAG: 4-hydroxythreonine-4-phosphate dehydrogenase PdxA [Planctomycetes bacterium]|nr:4-hydroxythreonine-4-phosphate dehydrogenase PdxA [Planctomycetota bacterium]